MNILILLACVPFLFMAIGFMDFVIDRVVDALKKTIERMVVE